MARFVSTSFAPVVIAMAITLSLGCGENALNETEHSGVIVKETLEDLPNCSVGKYALVYYVQDPPGFYFCDGWEYIQLDLSGLDGISWVVETTPALPEDCTAGGATISAGPDADRDGVLDSVTSSQTVCNGVDGQDGADGVDGTSCTVTSPSEGTVMISCEDGTVATVTDGQDGADGTACTVTDNGDGTKTISCDDGTLATVSDGQNGADGSSCAVADNGDDTKTISCDDGTSVTVSDGQDGANGTSCTVADNGDGTKTISCEDGTSVTVSDGQNGTSCTVADNLDGTYDITCGNYAVTVSDGQDGADGQDGSDGSTCGVVDNQDGTYAITCGDDSVVVSDGQDGSDGASCSIAHNGDGTATIACSDGTSVTVTALCVAIESPEVSCSDGIDNDCDGDVDSLDSDCCVITEPVEVSCNDGIDNDCDGVVDVADSDCCPPGEVKCGGYCEDLNNNPNCSTFQSQFLGSVSGDTGTQSLTDSYHGEKFYRLYVSEDDSNAFSPTYLSVQIDLNVPTGTNYDLTARCDDCNNNVVADSDGAGNESLILRWDEETTLGFPSGSDSGRDVFIEVVYVSAEVCADWTLTVTGNVSTIWNTCSPQ